MGFMSEISEDVGWNECISYLLFHLEDFRNTLQAGQYDYFPEDDIREALKKLIRKD